MNFNFGWELTMRKILTCAPIIFHSTVTCHCTEVFSHRDLTSCSTDLLWNTFNSLSQPVKVRQDRAITHEISTTFHSLHDYGSPFQSTIQAPRRPSQTLPCEILIFSPNAYNSLGIGTTQFYNTTWVYTGDGMSKF